MLMSGSRATNDDPLGRRSLARGWFQVAEREKGKFPSLVNGRKAA
jgi:hypothetical protein